MDDSIGSKSVHGCGCSTFCKPDEREFPHKKLEAKNSFGPSQTLVAAQTQDPNEPAEEHPDLFESLMNAVLQSISFALFLKIRH